jgi:flagellar hook-associated protein 2
MAVSTNTVLDVPLLVSQLMSIERQPIDKLEKKITDYEAKISSFGTIKGLASTLQSSLATLTSKLSAYSARSSNTSLFTASAGSNAVAGSYTLSVTTLAKAQTLVAAGQTSSTAVITAGASTVSFVVGGVATDVTIGAGASLEDIRSAINAADLGVSATIVNDGSGAPYRLALAATETGSGNAVSSITVQSGGDDTLNSLLAWNPTSNAPATATLTQAVAAADAAFLVNGIPVTSASNTITDAIQGVTLTLKAENASATLTVERDTDGIVEAASTFIDAYNGLVSQLKSRSAYAAAGATAPTLAGDGTARLMLNQLRSIMATAATGGTLSYLAEIGISVQVDSSLKLDSATFKSAMANDFADVTNLLSSASGFLTRLDDWATSALQTGGTIDVRVDSLNDSIDSFNDQIDRLEAQMTQLEQRYTITYTNLNTLLSSMDNLSSYLTSQFSNNKS